MLYHHTTRKPVARAERDAREARRSRHAAFALPLPEDRAAIQHSIGQVLQRIAAREIDPRRAGLLLYGLQIASLNLPKEDPKAAARAEYVDEVIQDPLHGPLAPEAELYEDRRENRNPFSRLLRELDEAELDRQDKENKAESPTTLTTLRATAETEPAASSPGCVGSPAEATTIQILQVTAEEAPIQPEQKPDSPDKGLSDRKRQIPIFAVPNDLPAHSLVKTRPQRVWSSVSPSAVTRTRFLLKKAKNPRNRPRQCPTQAPQKVPSA